MGKKFNIHDWQAKQRLAENYSDKEESMSNEDIAALQRIVSKYNMGKIQNVIKIFADRMNEMDIIGIDAINEGHGLSKDDMKILKTLVNQIKQGTISSKMSRDFIKVLGFLVKSNIEQEKTKDLSKNEEVDEANVTGTGTSFQAGSGEAYATPYAFKRKRKKDLNEVSYRDFKRNTESTPRQKIAKGISQVGEMIKEIEKIVNHNFRLKTELDMNSGTFLRSTNKRIHELGARLKRIENKLREFSN